MFFAFLTVNFLLNFNRTPLMKNKILRCLLTFLLLLPALLWLSVCKKDVPPGHTKKGPCLCMWADTICSTPTDLNTYRNFNGDIEITQVDFNSGIISGVFKFDAVGDRCADTVKITKGRFDIKYK
jgi:hypothetical protein